jgi:putative FmdB family regulatory protein
MPIYEYKCPKCGVVEVMQGIKEKPLKKCPNCKNKVERQISSTSFVLKGSGWYATDYAKKTTPPADTASTANGTNGSASSSEASKPATEKGTSTSETGSSTSEGKAAPSSEKPAKLASGAKAASSRKSD